MTYIGVLVTHHRYHRYLQWDLFERKYGKTGVGLRLRRGEESAEMSEGDESDCEDEERKVSEGVDG